MNVTPQLDVAAKFLEQWKPGGPWLLCAFHEDRDPEAREFVDIADVPEWVGRLQAEQFNIYFHVNTCRAGLQKKALKADVMSMDWFHVDLDPDKDADMSEEQVRIQGAIASCDDLGLPPPTLVTFSGGGYQAFWRLADPIALDGDIKRIEDAERYNLQVERLLGGDSCHNADRVMRLPGTVNYPNAKKRKRGQVPVLAKIVRAGWESAYPLSEFVQAVERQDRGSGIGGGLNRPKVELPSGNVRRISPEKLMEELARYGFTDEDSIGRVLMDGEDLDLGVKPGRDGSRSTPFTYAVCELVRKGVPDETIYAIVTDPTYRISDHPVSKGRGMKRAVKRAIEFAKESLENDDLAVLNQEYALVESVGGQMRIMCERFVEATGRREIEFHRKDGFLTTHNNRKVSIAAMDGKGNVKMDEVGLGKFWLGHKYRRTYRDVAFFPGREFDGTLNLWRGFNVDAVPGECGLYLAHLKDNLCRGNEEYYNYLLHWMANAVQNPSVPGQVAIVMRGGQGTGKGVAASIFGHLFGIHYKHVVNPDHITGQFNSVLQDAALVFADECFAAGDRKQESALKTLITEERLRVEAKGVDSIETRNCVHLMMATNRDWSIAADWDDRRFFALNVGDGHKQDAAYFRAIKEQMENGGYEALMYRLLTMDLRDFNVRQCPKTDELRDQQDRTSDGTVRGFFLDALYEGRITAYHRRWRCEIPKREVVAWVSDWMSPRRVTSHSVTKFLQEMFSVDSVRMAGSVKFIDPTGREFDLPDPRAYVFPSLAECRRLWDEKFGAREWPDELPPIDDDQEF